MSEVWANYEEYTPKAEGIYAGQVMSVDRETGEYGEYVLIKFAILEGPEEGEITGAASLKFTPKSKLYGWTRALNGGSDLGFRDGFKPSMIVGKAAQLLVKHSEGGDGVVRDKITEMLPISAEQAAAIKNIEAPKTPKELAEEASF